MPHAPDALQQSNIGIPYTINGGQPEWRKAEITAHSLLPWSGIKAKSKSKSKLKLKPKLEFLP